jgi:hypothetical protein
MGRFHKPKECSFCGKAQSRVGKLIAGPRGVFICDECIDLCNEIIDEEGLSSPKDEAAASPETAGAVPPLGQTGGPARVSAGDLAAEFGLSEETAAAILAWVSGPAVP